MARWSTATRARRSGTSNNYSTVTAQWVPQVACYKCHFPYNPTFIDLIKSKVPSGERSYDSDDNHAWYLSEAYFNVMLPIMKAVFPNCTFNVITKAKVEEYSKGVASIQVVSTDKLAEEFFQLLEKAGLKPDRSTAEEKTIKREYLRAARHYHPDFNPAFASEMSRLNELWANLKGVYFK